MPRNRKRGRQSKKSKKKRLNQQITNLHRTSTGFHNEQDLKECVDIHLILLQCPLIKNNWNEFDQNILKEIATYSTGKCLDCIRCKSPFSILHGNTVDTDLYNIFIENDYTYYTSKDKWAETSQLEVDTSSCYFAGICFVLYVKHEVIYNSCFFHMEGWKRVLK